MYNYIYAKYSYLILYLYINIFIDENYIGASVELYMQRMFGYTY